MRNGIYLQAHTGVQSEYPDNTMPAFLAAAEQGYEMIELDLGVTSDRRLVVLHDEAINRTARCPDGSAPAGTVNISDITYEEALTYDFGLWRGEQFRGIKIPLFSEVIALAVKNNILLKIDNKIKRFSPENLELLFAMLRETGVRVCISCHNREMAERVYRELPGAEVSFDGLTDEKELSGLSALFGRERLSVWLPVDASMAKWAPAEWFATPGKAEIIRRYAKLCLWAIESVASFERAAALYRPYAVETTGIVKPEGWTEHEAKNI